MPILADGAEPFKSIAPVEGSGLYLPVTDVHAKVLWVVCSSLIEMEHPTTLGVVNATIHRVVRPDTLPRAQAREAATQAVADLREDGLLVITSPRSPSLNSRNERLTISPLGAQVAAESARRRLQVGSERSSLGRGEDKAQRWAAQVFRLGTRVVMNAAFHNQQALADSARIKLF